MLRAVWPELGERSRGSRRHPAQGSRLGRRGLPWWLGCLSSSAPSSPRTGMRLGTTWALPFGRSGSPFSLRRSCSSSGYDNGQARESAGGRTLRRQREESPGSLPSRVRGAASLETNRNPFSLAAQRTVALFLSCFSAEPSPQGRAMGCPRVAAFLARHLYLKGSLIRIGLPKCGFAASGVCLPVQ